MAGDSCPQCGAPKRSGARFCYRCGTRLADAQATYSPPPPGTPQPPPVPVASAPVTPQPPVAPAPVTPPPLPEGPYEGGTTLAPGQWQPPQPSTPPTGEPPPAAGAALSAPGPQASLPETPRGTFLPALAAPAPSMLHAFGGAAVGAVLGATLWNLNDPVMHWLTLILPRNPLTILLLGAVIAGAVQGIVTSLVAGGKGGTPAVAAGIGGLVGILLGVLILSIRFRFPAISFITQALSWRFPVAALLWAAAAAGLAFTNPLDRLARAK